MIDTGTPEALLFLNKMADFLPLMIFMYDIKSGEITFLNRQAESFIGADRADIYAPNGFFLNRLHPSDRLVFADFTRRSQDAADNQAIEQEYRLKQGETWHWYNQRCVVFTRNPDGSAGILLNLIEDITERRVNEETLLRFSTALKMTTDSVLITDLSNTILDANDAAVRMYGTANKAELVGQDWFNFITPADKDITTDGMRQVLMNGSLKGKELRITPRPGLSIPVEVSISIISNARRAFVGLVIITRDISERKKTEEQLRFISSYDVLTRLHNRFSFEEKLSELKNGGISPIGVLMIDADGLKKINDRFGHDRGDKYLIAIADILRSSFRPQDFIARIGGDEFIVLLPGTPANVLEQTLQRLKETIRTINQTRADEPSISLSIGSCTAETGEQLQQALFFADERMYAEKAQKKLSFAVD